MALRRKPAPAPVPPGLAQVRELLLALQPTPEDYAFARRMEAEVLARLREERGQ